ncbi:MAG: 6-phosphofructokinase [Candidatus Eisenbacteria bacterium]|nr:6-phosphofructokinase [Candidatus Eisenbacteria bacterium]
MKHIAVLTSGGDAPGMNAAIRAVVRTAISRGLTVTGAIRGYTGLICREFVDLHVGSVSNIIQLGGTILKTSRSDEFMEPEGRATAAANLSERGVDALVGIGGDGTFRGLLDLTSEYGIPVIGVPGTIDNDIQGTDDTIGFDTAVNTALESIDKIRDTAESHDRVFFIEVMGRHCGAIALEVGLAGGAEVIAVPEVPVDVDQTCDFLTRGRKRGKTSFIAVVAEGAYEGGASAFAKDVSERIGVNYRVSILGHVQRGGSPTSFDRVIASLMGRAAVEALLDGESAQMVAFVCGEAVLVPLEKAARTRKTVDLDLLQVAHVIST